MNYLVSVWLAINCIGTPIGTVVVGNYCVEPKFGLAIWTNGSYVTLGNSCTETFHKNTVRCNVDEECCYIPEGISMNITMTDLDISKNETKQMPATDRGPVPAKGRTFICVEQ